MNLCQVMKKAFVISCLLASAYLLGFPCIEASVVSSNAEASDNEILYADPTIFVEDSVYYLAGTRYGHPKGFALLYSTNLVDWQPVEPDSMILVKGEGSYGTDWFWAPQILKNNNGYMLTYTANEQTALAKSPSLTGRYTQTVIEPIDGSEHNIDSFIFTDDDGKSYLYHVRFNNGNFLWVGEFDTQTGKIMEGTLQQCFANDQPWECTPAYVSAPIMEGPTVIKLDGKYYLFYSANHYMSPDYAVGYAVADSPLGPWHKNPNNPIIHRFIVGEKGTGHGDIFKDIEGNYRYVFHVHNSDTVVGPRRTRIITLHADKDQQTNTYRFTADPSTLLKPHRH